MEGDSLLRFMFASQCAEGLPLAPTRYETNAATEAGLSACTGSRSPSVPHSMIEYQSKD
jgi:hypothetical protein